ncbi:MAG: kas 1 [Verrucomicrobiales bacterium]|nr:kas 1 [Verrucomicrobiales bacterium]
MKRVFVNGIGAVSPVGWTVEAIRNALNNGQVPANACVQRPGWAQPLACRRVPPPNPAPAIFANARLRRSTPITTFAASATLQAIADAKADPKTERIGIVLCVLAGCVQFTRRFYHEAWTNPATASPLVFAETVFNAPSSHVAAILPTASINYTLLGDTSGYLEGIALASDWLEKDLVDSCVVIGSEEIDWPILDAFHLFSHSLVCSEGAGALYLSNRKSTEQTIELTAITDPHFYSNKSQKTDAIKNVRSDLASIASASSLLCDSRVDCKHFDAPEDTVWRDWSTSRLSPKTILGEGMMAGAAWQCVAAIDALRQTQTTSAVVSISGCLQQAVGASFARSK